MLNIEFIARIKNESFRRFYSKINGLYLEVNITQEGRLFGCDIKNSEGVLLVGICPEYDTPEEAGFVAVCEFNHSTPKLKKRLSNMANSVGNLVGVNDGTN